MEAGASSETLVGLFARRVRESGEQAALLVPEGAKFAPYSWNHVSNNARRMASALAGAGVEPGDRVIQVSENRFEWLLVDLAVHMLRGVHVAVHASLSGPQIAYQIVDSGARLAILSNQAQADKLGEVADQLSRVKFLSHDEADKNVCPTGRPMERLGDLAARADEAEGRRLQDEALALTRPNDLATILYTSGTTGEPKGVMLSHGNLVSNALGTQQVYPLLPDDVRLCWLPLSHIFARTCDFYTWIVGGCQMALGRSRDTIVADCQSVRPTVLSGVPYFFDKVMRGLVEHGVADQPDVLSKTLGGRLRACTSGGAALPDHVAEFFTRRGIPLTQGYGLTETSPVMTLDTQEEQTIGSVGRPLPGVNVRIAEDGEVLTRGPNLMLGYWNKPQATAEAIAGGWFHTGDLGSLDDNGRLRITGRKKELIVTAAGKNVAPSLLEGLLCEDPLIAQAMVLGDGRNYLAALVVPNASALDAELRRRAIEVESHAAALEHPAVRALYEECIHRRLAGLSHCEQIGQFALLPQAFTLEAAELTPTLKLRRGVVAARYADVIRRMYGE